MATNHRRVDLQGKTWNLLVPDSSEYKFSSRSLALNPIKIIFHLILWYCLSVLFLIIELIDTIEFLEIRTKYKVRVRGLTETIARLPIILNFHIIHFLHEFIHYNS